MLAMPTLLIRFDIEKAGGAYGFACYERLFAALNEEDLEGTVLLDGDSSATLAGRENVNEIAIVCGVNKQLETIKSKLESNAEFMGYTASSPFALLTGGTSEPLVLAGNFKGGEFDGGGWPAAALKAVRERRAKEAEAAEPVSGEEPAKAEAPVSNEAATENTPEKTNEPAAEQSAAASPFAKAGSVAYAGAAAAASPFAKSTAGAKATPAIESALPPAKSAAATQAEPASETSPANAAAQPAPKVKAPVDPARAAKNKRAALLAAAAVLALGWCALLCVWLPGVFKSTPVKYNTEQLAAALPEAVVEACRRTGDSNAYIEALAEECVYPTAEELEGMIDLRSDEEIIEFLEGIGYDAEMISELPEREEGKPYSFILTMDVPMVTELDSSSLGSGGTTQRNIEEFKSRLADAEKMPYEVQCLVDYDGIYLHPTQMKEIVQEGNAIISETLGVDLEQPVEEGEGEVA